MSHLLELIQNKLTFVRENLIELSLILYVIYATLLKVDHSHLTHYEYVEFSESQFLIHPNNNSNLCLVVEQFGANDWGAIQQLKFSFLVHMPVNDNVNMTLSTIPSDSKNTISIPNHNHDKSKTTGFKPAWMPSDCYPVHNVTIVVPYRDRLIQLKKFITYMTLFLQLQKLAYKIIVVEQLDNLPFNRAKLLNIGFVESSKRFPSECYIFNDVDILPENLKNMYGCTKQPRHMSAAVNSFRYLLSYEKQFGGVTSMTREQFLAVNGYSNEYFGWGGEDDDMLIRLNTLGFNIVRFNSVISSYTMLPHKKASAGQSATELLKKSDARFEYDGLNSLNYTLISFKEEPLFTHLQVKL